MRPVALPRAGAGHRIPVAAGFVSLVFAFGAYGNEVLWTFHAPAGHVDASPAVGDIDGDGVCDIVVTTTAGSVIALGPDGFEKWRWDVNQPISVPPSLGDVAGDTTPEVLVLSNSGRLLCLDGGTGSPIWTFDLPGKLSWAATSVVAADVNQDGKTEIVTADSAETLVCLNGQGAPLWTLAEPGGWRTSPAVGDLDGDGCCEILMGSDRCPLVCVSHDGKELWRLDPKGPAATSPVIWDLDGDGTPEILTGVGATLTAVDAKGKVLWQHAMSRDIDAAISVADADRDGQVEVYAVDLNGQVACVSGAGKLRWTASVKERARRSPAIADVDADGHVEIVVGGYDGAMYVFDAKSKLKERITLSGDTNATPAVVDLAGDGRLQVICPTTGGDVLAFQWQAGKASPVVLWPEYRYTSARTAAATPASAKSSLTLAKTDFGRCHVGTNTFTVRVANPERKRLNVSLTVTGDGKTLSKTAVSSPDQTIPCRLSYTLTGRRAVTLTFACIVKDGETVVLRRRHVEYVAPFIRELAEVDEALSRLTELLGRLPDASGLKERVHFLRDRMPGYRDRVQVAVTLSGLERRRLCDEFADLRTVTARLLAVAEHVVSTSSQTGLLACAANPWAPFGGVDEAAEGRISSPNMVVEAFYGEVEAAALNVFNANGRSMTLRVELPPITKTKDKTSIPAGDVVAVREVVDVPTLTLDLSGDALPSLNQGRTVVVPAWGARQLWFSIDTSRLTPGTWTGQVRLRALDVQPRELSASIAIEVWDAKLPSKQALRLCHWGYVHRSVLRDQPAAALADQIAHGTNVFVGMHCPQAKFDKNGELVGQVDYKAHDAYVRRHAPHGIILFGGWPLTGPAKPFTPTWTKAAVAHIRAWVKHLAEMGVRYEGFAFYPVDEPGLRDGLVDTYINYAKVAREADPKIQMYTDPVGGASLADLKKMAPYVDIWCPNRRGFLMGIGADKLAFIKSTGKTVWTYECEGNAKHQSPLGYYRGQAWLVWHHGLTGIGFWNYCVGPEPWYHKGEYTMIYQGDGVVPSKRWEAVRDGIEDYSMLAALRQAADAAEAASRAPEAVKAARQILSKDAAAIAAYCGGVEHGTLPGVDGARGGRIVADKRWSTIRSTRRKIAKLLAKLTVNKP